MLDHFRQRDFLPAQDPLRRFPPGSPYAVLDEAGAALPERLHDWEFRRWAESLHIPPWDPGPRADPERASLLYCLRAGFPAPELLCYSRESTIAEKFQANVALGALNSRMKGFYDIWLLSRQFDFGLETLAGPSGRPLNDGTLTAQCTVPVS